MQLHQIQWDGRDLESAALHPHLPGLLQALAQGVLRAVPANL